MKFYKRLIFCVLFIFFSCEKYKVISSFELSIKDPWSRKEVVEKKLTVDNDGKYLLSKEDIDNDNNYIFTWKYNNYVLPIDLNHIDDTTVTYMSNIIST